MNIINSTCGLLFSYSIAVMNVITAPHDMVWERNACDKFSLSHVTMTIAAKSLYVLIVY